MDKTTDIRGSAADIMLKYVSTVGGATKACRARLREISDGGGREATELLAKLAETEAKADGAAPFNVVKTFKDLAQYFNKKSRKFEFVENTLIIASPPEGNIVQRGGISGVGMGHCLEIEALGSLGIVCDISDRIWSDVTAYDDLMIAGYEVNVAGKVNVVDGSLTVLPVDKGEAARGIEFSKSTTVQDGLNIDPRFAPDTEYRTLVRFYEQSDLRVLGRACDPNKLSNAHHFCPTETAVRR
ncbi:MAG: hypothetical protein FWE53_01515 [Firmicutes bacterium]|nr:hypothetical protein [Bacillota bacterium]